MRIEIPALHLDDGRTGEEVGKVKADHSGILYACDEPAMSGRARSFVYSVALDIQTFSINFTKVNTYSQI